MTYENPKWIQEITPSLSRVAKPIVLHSALANIVIDVARGRLRHAILRHGSSGSILNRIAHHLNFDHKVGKASVQPLHRCVWRFAKNAKPKVRRGQCCIIDHTLTRIRPSRNDLTRTPSCFRGKSLKLSPRQILAVVGTSLFEG